MKTDRLLGILTILVQNPKVKAKDLAKCFEVSLRTIYRDIETISLAGIPIVTYPGGNGELELHRDSSWIKAPSLGRKRIVSRIPIRKRCKMNFHSFYSAFFFSYYLTSDFWFV
ncbi:MAG TPA: HTH domain-containing protein [Clostridiales bacterium]|nr:HTH domain-containing protein [Clostridiales bacterium]